MWSQLLLCALVGLAAASSNGWESNQEYVYKVHGRTLTGLHEISNQYSGIMMKARIVIRPESEEQLMAKIVDAKYGQVNTNLPEGWRSDIHESEVQYQTLQLSEKPFKIEMKRGVVQDVIVSPEVNNWEANIIKSIVSQMQLDTQGQNVIKAHVNQLPEEGSNNAVFKTMEDTITGTYETLYDISPLPEYVMQSQQWIVPMPELKKDGEFIEIVKSKNFSRGEERLGYYYGLGGMGQFEPNTNKMGDFLSRSSVSRAVISGSLKHFIIQSSVTTNKIVVRPTLNSQQKGMVVSHLNITLENVKQVSGSFEQLQQGQKLGSLTYTFNTPFSGEHQARQGQKHVGQQQYMYSSEEERHHYRQRRSAQQSSESESVNSEEEWAQDEAQLNQPPHSPLLPMYIGYKGKSVKNSDKVQVVQVATKLAKQIGNEIQHPEQIPKEQSLAKFVLMGSIARIMSESEMEQVAKQLYTKEIQGGQAEAWNVYRDTIAECGTGPALLTIQKWIKERKIQGEEAAEIVATMAESVRQPTEEYIRTFYNLATKEQEVQSQALLNDSAILSYCTLVRKVYVDKKVSHNQFPVHSFGKFRTENGKQFVAQELVPHLKEKLNHAVQNGDSHKVLVYIRALGNVADQKILSVFEPYLEGEKQCSQFQRLQMVIALDKFVKIHPKIARSVLYKIYQNAGEEQEIRAAAVYQLMRTCPPASMLQRMAQYTNIDTAEQVNAAIQSAIDTAAQLQGEEFGELSENARSAQSLLTKKSYGLQYSRDYLRSYVQEEMNLSYKQTVQTYGSQDSVLPKGIKYALRAGLGGARRQIFNVQAMVSSIDELTNVIYRQTEKYQQKQQQQEQNYQQAQQHQFSSESIAKMLNIKNDEREQLEGSILFQVAGGVTRYFTFNNRTVELLPEVIREVEDMLRQGEQLQYTKFLNRYEIAVSFPTEMALPFIYTLDAPTLLHISGQVRATAEPKISSGENIRKPHTITAHAEVRALVATKLQAKIGFVTPFDHQQYTSGYDKNMQVYLPISSQIEVDLKKQQMHAQIQAVEPQNDAQVFHYSTWPYTAHHDILHMEPIANRPNTKIIHVQKVPNTQFETIVGKNTGLALRVKYVSEQKFLDAYWLYQQINRQDAVTAMFAPFYDESIQHTKIDVQYDAAHSSARKVQIRMGYETRNENGQSQGPAAEISQFNKLPMESKARQEQFVKMASSGIIDARATVGDISIELDGQNKVQYVATIASADSLVDEKSRVLVFMKKYSGNQQESRPYEVAMSAKTHTPKTNTLDFNQALKMDVTTTTQIDLAFGEDYQSSTKINVHGKLQKSEGRKEYLNRHPRAQECRKEMQQGNKQLSACANMTAEANLLDRVHLQVQFENVGPKVRNMTNKVYNGLRYLSFFNLDENTVNAEGSNKDNQIEFVAKFEPDFESCNVTLKTHKMVSQINNIRVNNWVKQIVAVHPAYPVSTRVMGEVFDYDSYKPICVVDKTAVNTFDNKTYSAELGNEWTVMLQYVPQFAREGEHRQNYEQQQKEQQLEQFAVLVRESKSENEKEVKITIRTPQTEGKVTEIDLKSVQGDCSARSPCAKVYVNQKQIVGNANIEGGYIHVQTLPHGEVMVKVQNAFNVIFNGERVKVEATHDKLRDAVRGLCGTFTGEQSDDFVSAKNCILRDARHFIESYTLGKQSGQQHQGKCYYKNVVYTNVVSDFDAGRSHQKYYKHSSNKHQHQHHESQSEGCTKHQTRYIVDESQNQICFTIRPVPVCKSSCNASRMVGKSVPVHCVQRTNVAELWKKQIEKGASPDFSLKTATRSAKVQVPESCSQY